MKADGAIGQSSSMYMAPPPTLPLRSRRQRAAGGCGLAVCLWSPLVFGQPVRSDEGCADDHVTLSGSFDDAWTRAVTKACASLQSLPDRDAEARLELEAADPGVRVRVRLADGRSASRTATRPEDLAAVIEALVTLPPPVSQPRLVPDRVGPGPAVPAAAAPGSEPAGPIPVAVDIAALATTRILGEPATLALGVVVSANLNIDEGWLVGVRARLDPMQSNLEHDGEIEDGAYGGGVEVGRRVRPASALAIDFGLGVDGLADISYEDGHQSGGRRADEATGDVRTRAFGKLWASGDGLSFAALAGFEISPLRLADDARHEAPRPSYGGELGVGIGWGGL